MSLPSQAPDDLEAGGPAGALTRGVLEILASARGLDAALERRVAEAVALMLRAARDPRAAGGPGNLSPAQVLAIRASKLVARELPAAVYRARRSELRAAVQRLIGGLGVAAGDQPGVALTDGAASAPLDADADCAQAPGRGTHE